MLALVVTLCTASACSKSSSGGGTAPSATGAAPPAATTAAAAKPNLPVKGPWDAITVTLTKKDPDGTGHFHVVNTGSRTVSSVFMDLYAYDAKGKQLAHKDLSFSRSMKGGGTDDFSTDPLKDVDTWQAVYHGIWFDGDAKPVMDDKRAPAQRPKAAN